MASTPEYIDFSKDDNHNASPQKNVTVNDDPALNKDHEHQHPHLHHDTNAKKGREDEVVYSQDTESEAAAKGLPNIQSNSFHQRQGVNVSKGPMGVIDTEKGSLSQFQTEEDPQTHTLLNFYSRYRIFFHLFIWLVFTGWWIAGLILHGK